MTESESFAHRLNMLETLPFPALIMSPDGTIVNANARFCQTFGLATPCAWGKILPPQLESEFLQILQREGRVTGYEFSFGAEPASVRWFSLSAFPVQARDLQGFLVSLMDIHRQKASEQHSNRQMQRLQALYEIDQAIMAGRDLNSILHDMAQSAIVLLEVDAATILLLDEDSETLDFAAREGFRTDATRFTRLKLGQGLAGRAAQTLQTVQIDNLQALTDNPILAQALAGEEFVAYIGVPLIAQNSLLGVMEIFHRSRLQFPPDWFTFLDTLASQAAIAIYNARLLHATRQRLEELDALYEINRDLAASLDPDTLMQNVCDLLAERFAYAYVQVFVRDPASGDFLMRAGSGETGRSLKQLGYRLAAGEGIVGFTAETLAPFFTNDVDQMISFSRPPFLPDTKSELAVPIVAARQFLGLIDVHQKPPLRLSDKDVRLVTTVADQLAESLQKADLYADLQESLKQEKAIRAQLIHNEKLTIAGRLLASVSHELNNPLQAIQNALYLLKTEGSFSEQGRQDLEIILDETERMAAMLQRLRSTYLPVNRNEFFPVQVNDLIEEVAMLVGTHLRHSQVTFAFHPQPDLPLVRGLEDQLRQVILNLVINAVDAMPEGGTLQVATQFLTDSNEVLILVADTGTGIAPEILETLFEPFITTKERGTGLGLNICRQIVQTHRGRIAARNNPQSGAAFSVWLPAAV